MTRVAIISANLGGFDQPVEPVPQVGQVQVDYHCVTSVELPPRPKSLSPRLQAKIPKMFGWDLYPGYDAYLWVDASLAVSSPDTTTWFLDRLGQSDIAVFRHPFRATAQAEADYVQTKMAAGNHYLLSRYEHEDTAGQLRALAQEPSFVDDRLYAAGAFCYRPTARLQAAMASWWCHTSRFHVIDQLAFPFVLWQHQCAVQVIPEDIYHASHLTWGRRRRG